MSAAGEQRRPAAVSARERSPGSAVQCAPWSVDWLRVPPRSSASIGPPPGAAASASGTSARPGCSGLPGCQFVPLSRVAVSAEKVRSTPGRNPAIRERLPWVASTNPPLVATPGGVTSFQMVLSAERVNSCENALSLVPVSPMTTAAQVPVVVASEVFSDGARTATDGAAWWLAAWPHPAAHAASTVIAIAVRAAALRGACGRPLHGCPRACRAASASSTAYDEVELEVPGPGSSLSSSRMCPERSRMKAMSSCAIMAPPVLISAVTL